MNLKRLFCLALGLVLILTIPVQADEPYITASSQYTDSGSIIISGTLHGASDDMITFVFGDVNAPLYVAQKCIEDGKFEFEIMLSSHVPEYEYTYILSTRSAQFKGKFETTKNRLSQSKSVLTADMNFSVKNYVPSFNGTAYCAPGQTLTVLIKDTTSNTEIVADTFTAEDGQYDFSYTLPKLTLNHNYTMQMISKNGEETTVSANMNVSTSLILLSFSGPIYAAPNYSLYVNVQSVKTNLIDKSMRLKGDTSNVNFTIPNLISDCDFKITVNAKAEPSSYIDGAVNYLKNPELYNALKSKLPHFDSENTGVITIEELESVKGILDLSNKNITYIDGLQYCSGVTHLYLNDNNIYDISPLLTLTNLRYLDASNNRISSLYRIPTYLRYMDLSGNNLQDVDVLRLTNTLVQLDISDNNIKTVFPLKNHKLLRYLDIRYNRITDISTLPQKKYAKLLTKGNRITNQ